MPTINSVNGGAKKQEKTVTAGTSAIIVTPDQGSLLSSVTINPTPSEAKTQAAGTSNVTVTPSSGKLLSQVTITPTPSETKTVTPSSSVQTVTPSSGKLLSKVTVNAGLAGTMSIRGVFGQYLSSNTTISTVFNQTVSNNTSYITKTSASQLTIAKAFKGGIVVSLSHGNNLYGTANSATFAVNGTNRISITGQFAIGSWCGTFAAGDKITGTFKRTDNNQQSAIKITIFEIV